MRSPVREGVARRNGISAMRDDPSAELLERPTLPGWPWHQ